MEERRLIESKEFIKEIFAKSLEAADPYKAVALHTAEILAESDTRKYNRLFLVAFGKAASSMSNAVAESLGDKLSEGIMITKYGHTGQYIHSKKIRVFEAGHPLPDENGLKGTQEVLRLMAEADEKTLIVCLISGGGSALLVSPYKGITLAEKHDVTDLLLKAGADIFELNALRKHISAVKGGRLAEVAYPAAIVSLILSDVIGDRLDVIASGPTSPDRSTYQDVLNVIAKYDLAERIPRSVAEILIKGAQGLIPETPKEANPIFRNVKNTIVGSNAMAVEAAREAAELLGYETKVLSTTLSGEASLVAKDLAKTAMELRKTLSQSRKMCLLSGGETTVTVKGAGKGGRNTELVLAFAIEIQGSKGMAFLSAGTDGTDGPTDAAGAIADGQTVEKALAIGLDPHTYLTANDSYTFFRKIDDLVITGPTGTNVMDIQIILLES